jgi:hypothetical protein
MSYFRNPSFFTVKLLPLWALPQKVISTVLVDPSSKVSSFKEVAKSQEHSV